MSQFCADDGESGADGEREALTVVDGVGMAVMVIIVALIVRVVLIVGSMAVMW